jgi:formylglycine-generating enzyme required for sulfatase activity
MSSLPLPSQTLAWLNHAANAGQRDAQALLHLIARADQHDQDVAKFVDSYSSTIAALCRRLEALERGVNDLPAPAAPVDDSLIRMVLIPAGSFLMGSPTDEPERFDDEGPQHEVTLGSFFMAKTLITQAQWREVAGWPRVERELDLNPSPSHFKGDNRPVEQVSWLDAMEFCHRLRQRTGKKYTLPSEAQWEYACRAGSTTPFHFGPTISTEVANYNGNYTYGQGLKGIYRQQTTDVASFPANAWGLHDMHGNVWEWCLDEWHKNYDGAPVDGSAWGDHSLGESPGDCCEAGRGSTTPGSAARLPDTSSTRTPASASSVSASVASPDRLLRGGSWDCNPRYCRSAYRGHDRPVNADYIVGFRVVCLPQD